MPVGQNTTGESSECRPCNGDQGEWALADPLDDAHGYNGPDEPRGGNKYLRVKKSNT